jgi:hypothetical protein
MAEASFSTQNLGLWISVYICLFMPYWYISFTRVDHDHGADHHAVEYASDYHRR